MFLNNIKQSKLILGLRNSLNIKPIQILLPNDTTSYSISDAFVGGTVKISKQFLDIRYNGILCRDRKSNYQISFM